MSRAALARQLQNAVAAGKSLSADAFEAVDPYLPTPDARARSFLQGNERTFNIEIVLATNIVSDHVFLEELLPMTRLDQLLDYMYDNVAHVEPCKIGSARSASPAFMCLYRLAMFAPAARDMMRVLNSRDSVYIRAVGFLLLRYAAAPEEVWTWFEPYLDDATPFQPSGEGKGRSISFGEWLRELLTEMRYFTTHLPRLPTLIARDISVRIALAAKDDERAARNAPFASRLAPGMKVRARYSEDGKMYDATLDRAAGPNDSIHYKGRWMVTYTEFGNAEIRSLGHLDLTDVVGDAGAAARDRSASSAFRSSSQAARDGGRHRSRSPSYAHGRQREEYDRDRARADNTERSSAGCGDEEDMESLRERVLARERNKVVVGAGRDYASRVMGLKESMTVRETHLSGSARAAADERRQANHTRGSDRRYDAPPSPPRGGGDRYAEDDRRRGDGGHRDSAYEPRARYHDDDRRGGGGGGGGMPYDRERDAAPSYSRTTAAAAAGDSTTSARTAAVPTASSSTLVAADGASAPVVAPAAAAKPSAAALSRMQELMKKYGGGATAAAPAPASTAASAAPLGVQDRDGEHVQRVAGWSA